MSGPPVPPSGSAHVQWRPMKNHHSFRSVWTIKVSAILFKGEVGPDSLTLWMACVVYTCTLFVKEVTHTFANTHHCNVKVMLSCNVASQGLLGEFKLIHTDGIFPSLSIVRVHFQFEGCWWCFLFIFIPILKETFVCKHWITCCGV